MYASGFILGFHGCDAETGEHVLPGNVHVAVSANSHDWLGTGAYFWENSVRRALEWAKLVASHPQHFRHRVRHPFVLGAIIEPGRCLDLSESESLEELKRTHELLTSACRESAVPLPVNDPASPETSIS